MRFSENSHSTEANWEDDLKIPKIHHESWKYHLISLVTYFVSLKNGNGRGRRQNFLGRENAVDIVRGLLNPIKTLWQN